MVPLSPRRGQSGCYDFVRRHEDLRTGSHQVRHSRLSIPALSLTPSPVIRTVHAHVRSDIGLAATSHPRCPDSHHSGEREGRSHFYAMSRGCNVRALASSRQVLISHCARFQSHVRAFSFVQPLCLTQLTGRKNRVFTVSRLTWTRRALTAWLPRAHRISRTCSGPWW